MRRILLIVCAILLIAGASATSLNFQNPGDYNYVTYYGMPGTTLSGLSWSESTSGANNYIIVSHARGGYYTVFTLKSSVPTTYASSTLVGRSGGVVDVYFRYAAVLFDDTKTPIAVIYNTSTYFRGSDGYGKWEVKISGGNAYLTKDGQFVGSVTGLSANPSYVGFGSYPLGSADSDCYSYWDDYVYGQTENMITFGIPESDDDAFVILQDVTSSANDGVYNTTSHTQANANYMSSTWSRGNITIGADSTQPNLTLQLENYYTHVVYATNYTGNGYAGIVDWNIKTKLLDVNAPDGFYAITSPSTGAYSNVIKKTSNGATVNWGSKTYSLGDTGTVIYYVLDGGYWNTATYDYKIAVFSLIDGFKGNTSLSSQSGSVTHSWSESDPTGVYYALLYATSKTTGQEYIIGSDYTTVSSYVNFNGYVNDAQTTAIISGANVSMVQDSIVCNSISLASGAYNCTGFIIGSPLEINATATGHRRYNYTITPAAPKTIYLNISLVADTPTYTGFGIGGVDRDTIYGRPIEGATVIVKNTSLGTTYAKTTSMTGWYLCDDGASCSLVTKTPYSVWGQKVGYLNSANYTAVTG